MNIKETLHFLLLPLRCSFFYFWSFCCLLKNTYIFMITQIWYDDIWMAHKKLPEYLLNEKLSINTTIIFESNWHSLFAPLQTNYKQIDIRSDWNSDVANSEIDTQIYRSHCLRYPVDTLQLHRSTTRHFLGMRMP